MVLGMCCLCKSHLTSPQVVTTKSLGDVTLIHDEVTGDLTAFNLFNASSYMKVETVGEVELTEEVAKSTARRASEERRRD